jgi:uncharacterized protein
MNFKPLWWISLVVVLVGTGCFSAGRPTVYFTLNPLAGPVDQRMPSPATQWVIGIGPLEMPEYLDRLDLVTRISPNRVVVHANHRWAASLQSEILRVLVDNLALETRARQVVSFPWDSHFEPDLQIAIQIQAFEGELGGKVRLRAAWSLTPAQADQPALRRVSDLEQDTAGGTFEDLVAAMGQVLGRLSLEMAAAVAKAGP